MWSMRTTIELPEDLRREVELLASETARSLDETVADLIRRGLAKGETARITTRERTGLPLVHLGRVVTSEDVRSLEDDDTDDAS